jgi:NAD(P)-dependent dehydrogenase (short-subunit alcohol dehydrogenase family)
VTGAASGIGRSCAAALAREGAGVLVVDLDERGGSDTAAAIGSEGGVAEFVIADVSRPEDLVQMFDTADDRLGGVDLLFNNAGIVCGEPLWPGSTLEKLSMQLMVNLGSVILGTRLAIDRLGPRGGGAIVNTSSLGALLPLAEEPGYSATKAGVAMFTRACAGLKDSHNIRVNAVLPGLVDTPLLAKSGSGSTEAEWARLARDVFSLLSPDEVAAEMIAMALDERLAGQCRIVGELPQFVSDMLERDQGI